MNPKERFIKLPLSKIFADMVASDPFQIAMDHALLEMQMTRSMNSDAASEHFMMMGALELRRILESISIPEEVPKPPRTPTLNHDAYNRPTRT